MEKIENKNNTAINVSALTLGIISIVASAFYYITYPAGILAIVFGSKGAKATGSKLAKTGVILGIVGMSIATLLYIAMISIIILASM